MIILSIIAIWIACFILTLYIGAYHDKITGVDGGEINELILIFVLPLAPIVLIFVTFMLAKAMKLKGPLGYLYEYIEKSLK